MATPESTRQMTDADLLTRIQAAELIMEEVSFYLAEHGSPAGLVEPMRTAMTALATLEARHTLAMKS